MYSTVFRQTAYAKLIYSSIFVLNLLYICIYIAPIPRLQLPIFKACKLYVGDMGHFLQK